MANADLLTAPARVRDNTPVHERPAHEPQYACVVEPLDTPVFRWKTGMDRCIAALLLVPGLPMIGLLVAAVKLTSKGPGIYSQVRVGRGGRIFTMYKLRSMRLDAETGSGPVWASLGADSRVTRLGYWLRRLHLDELPQLFNVLRGEMSLVGPRPERPEFVKVLADKIDGYLDRLQIKPGITGLAQINLPGDTDLDSVRRKLLLDCEYIRDAGLFYDLRIIACTLLKVVGIRGGLTRRFLGLDRKLPGSYSAGETPTSVHAVAKSQALENTVSMHDPHVGTVRVHEVEATRQVPADNIEPSLS
jgi:lipopolysaccharide/colanic/teichoic acid biosynthesis glycosyltransferase